MLVVEGLKLDYAGVHALDGVSLEVADGAITTVVGSNGAGKTSLMKAICGLEKPSSGRITFDGDALIGLSPAQIVRKGIVLVPEGRELFPRMTVRDNLMLGASLVNSKSTRTASLERVLGLFPVLERKLSQQARNLSGGEQQMVAFGRALMASPSLLLLDEPSIGLAPMIEEQLMASIRDVSTQLGVSILLVEQNAMLALENSRYAYVMELGRIVRSDESAKLINDPAVVEAYLGG
jgi:branched-chain amino acid transport system ATP-binding protein